MGYFETYDNATLPDLTQLCIIHYRKLLEEGVNRILLDDILKTHCLGCGYLHEDCQCNYSGSAHPTDKERFNYVRKCLIQEKHL